MATIAGSAKKTKFDNLRVGSNLSETQYYKVEKIVGDQVQVKSDSGESIVLPQGYVDALITVADFYTSEEKKNRTELIQIFASNPGVAMTVNFNKKVDPKAVKDEILKTVGNTAPNGWDKEILKSVNKAMEGEERTAEGRQYGHTDEFGRYQFVDMNKDKGTSSSFDGRQILVDPRTISWIIVKGVKYTLK